MEQLRARNVPCVAVSLPLLLHRIECARPALDAAVRRLHAATGMAPVLAAHSMGGLVVRDWLRGLPEGGESDAVIPPDVLTIGSPHHGSLLACFVMGANVRQMRPGSQWLDRLREDEARVGSAFSRVRWHCVYSDCDNVVFPESTTVLDEADAHLLAGYAHVQMLSAPAMWALLHALVARDRG
ncbi:hypothetical protein SDC9_154827 [bioreactor metagenome]|uniref:AB hydrolase-1 domain-containing protein n=1 Tax=bioreactor metagenome TaxID=1076179 RepID=A0A645F1L6_9ZZZZ